MREYVAECDGRIGLQRLAEIAREMLCLRFKFRRWKTIDDDDVVDDGLSE